MAVLTIMLGVGTRFCASGENINKTGYKLTESFMDVTYEISPQIHNWMLNELLMATWREQHQDVDWRPVLKRSLFWVGAYAGKINQLVGFCNVGWDGGKHAFLLDLTVRPNHQRQGIGTQIVKHAIEQTRANRMQWLHVDYPPHLAEFYQGCGFQHTAAGLIDLRK